MRPLLLDPTAQPVKNLVQGAATAATAATPGWGTAPTPFDVAAGGDGPLGGRAYRRRTATSAFTPTTGSDIIAYQPQNFGVSSLGMACQAVPGRSYSLAWPVRSSVAQKVRLQAQMIAAGGGAPGNKSGPDATLVPGQWTVLVAENCVPGAGAVGIRPDVDVGASPIAWATGDTFDAGRPFVYEGAALPPGLPADGDTPGWRWLGAVGTSESVGYPYTLESIAGRPGLVLDGSSFAPADSTDLLGTLNVPDLAGRSLYSVHDVVTTANDDAHIARLGDALGGTTRVRVSYSNQSLIGVYTNASDTNMVPNFSNGRVLGRHTAALIVADGLTSISAHLENQSTSTLAIPSPTALSNKNVRGMRSTPGVKAVYTVAYEGAHNAETRRRVTAWLARRFGAPIPAGY